MGAISILAVGQTQREEFRRARAALDRAGRVLDVPNVDAAAEAIAQDRIAPDLIVVAQAFPGEFTSESIDRLRRLAPVAALVGLLGSWCEGETRTGDPWPAAIRIYWHQWEPRADRELRDLVAGLGSTWGLPVTASDEERMLASQGAPPARRSGAVAICTWRYEMAEWLSEACRRAGYSPVWLRPGQPMPAEELAAVIFDGSEADAAEIRQLEDLASASRGAVVLALLDFPRIEDSQRVCAAGAAAVLSKPLLLEELYWQLDRAVAQR